MKTVKFYKNDNIIRIFDYDNEQVVDKIAPAIYTLCQDISGGFFLNFASNSFDVPEKVYGSTKSRVDKILKTYDSRVRSTGVLMSGDKGSGKTMLSSLLSNNMIKRGLPVILIERPFQGNDFIEFLNNIGECVLFFDEFGKVFAGTMDDDGDKNNDSQNGLLSVFDGAHTIKRLILLTENETYNINSYMLNRPGRIFYHFKYKKLEEALVREYCEANKVPDNVINALLLRIDSSLEFSFDALSAVVEEYKRFNEDVEDIFNNLNIEEPRKYANKMKVVKVFNTKTQEDFEVISGEITMQNGTVGSIMCRTGNKRLDGREGSRSILFSIKDIVERTEDRQVYSVENGEIIIVLEKMKESPHTSSYEKFLSY